MIRIASTASSSTIKNNIFANYEDGTNGVCIREEGNTSSEDVIIDNNVYYSAATNKFYYPSTTYTSMASWKTGSGQGWDLNSIEGDPDFVNINGGDFHINEASFAQTVSTPITSPIVIDRDFEGDSRDGANPDAGYDENLASDSTAPSEIVALTALQGLNDGEIDLIWTATGDDGNSNNITGGQFAIQYSSYVVAWSTIAAQVTESTDTVQGEEQKYTITGLTFGATYYVRIWMGDEVPNWSLISNGTTNWAQVDVTPPGQVTGFTVATGLQVELNWTAPGNNGYVGDVVGGVWQINYSSTVSVGTSLGPDFAEYFVQLSSSWTQGTTTFTRTITNLKPRTTYYFWKSQG
ncbi:hypothetical protein ACFLR5_02060 [Elusimicrobiota bacterium]